MLFAINLLIVLKFIHWLLAHETIFRMSKKRREFVKKNGLLHYTTVENAEKIVRERKLVGENDVKSTFPSHRKDKIIWFFGCSDTPTDRFFRWCVLRRHSPRVHTGQRHSIKYETKLLVQDLSDEQISKMKINIEMGIGCYMEEMKDIRISYAPLDGIDKKLGVKSNNGKKSE